MIVSTLCIIHSESKAAINMTELSVVIPTYNRQERLQACLEALAHQTQPHDDFEVIVVVDGSTDGTKEMLQHLVTPYRLKILLQENQGQHLARNHGVEHALGRYCLFLDDDIMAEPDLVAEHLKLHRLQEKKVGIGQMTLLIPEDSDWFTVSYARRWHRHYEELNDGIRKPAWFDCYGGNLSMPRSMLLDVGGFAADIRRSHDIELGYRLDKHGMSFAYLPHAIGRQDDHKGVRELAADAARSGAAWVELCQRYPEMGPHLLGSILNASLRESIFREFLWALRIPLGLLVAVGNLLKHLRRDQKWYRFLFGYFYWRGFRQVLPDHDARQRLKRSTPVLMYHAFAGPGERTSRFILSARQFARQVLWLKRLGYCVISLEEYLGYQRHSGMPPGRSVVVTIDDGYAEVPTLVYPILQEHGVPATLFLVSSMAGTHNNWAKYGELRGRPLASWAAIRSISPELVQFGAHTRRHPALTRLTLQQAQEEIVGSKVELERALGLAVRTFAYPFGDYNEAVQALVENAGFMGACSADPGSNSLVTQLTALRRIEVKGTWSLPRFLLTVWLGSNAYFR
jgi:glycosyltransferase involved in cell wall biosynthesis